MRQETTPRALVSLGGLFLVDGEGEALQRLGSFEECNLPVIFGLRRELLDTDPHRARTLLARAVSLIGAAERGGLNEVLPLCEVHLAVDGRDVLVLENGTRVHLPRQAPLAALEKLGEVLGREIAQRDELPRVVHLAAGGPTTETTVRTTHDRGRVTENNPTGSG